MPTLAIHMVWTTYMTWPPGDARGHWSPLFDLYGRLAARGGCLQLPDAATRRHAGELAKEPPKLLDAEEMAVVAGAFAAQIAPGLPGGIFPDPRQAGGSMPVAFAAAIEPNHVHLLLGPVEEDLAKYVGRLKGTSSSAIASLPRNRNRRKTWTAGYWHVFLFDELAVATVKAYIEDHNLRRGLPRSPFSWLSPCPYAPVAGEAGALPPGAQPGPTTSSMPSGQVSRGS